MSVIPRTVQVPVESWELPSAIAAELNAQEIVDLIQDIEETAQNWEIIKLLHPWVIRRHRTWAQERADEQARDAGHCVTSEHYPDIHGHTDPHIECVLR